MYYLVYKITNGVNDKIYIGVHKTEDKNDGYIGSGKVLKRAIDKYGIEHFTKEILYECKSQEEMFQREADIVNEEFVSRRDTYNIKYGGFGGWDYVNVNGLGLRNGCVVSDKTKDKIRSSAVGRKISKETRKKIGDANRGKVVSEEAKKKMSESKRKMSEETKQKIREYNIGRKHSEDTKRKISESHKGKKNSNYGKCWVYSIEKKESLRIKKEELDEYLSNGWIKGRKMKFE